MQTVLISLLALLAAAPGEASAGAPATSDLDQLLENVAAILDEPEAYHIGAEGRDAPPPLALTLDSCVALAIAQNTQVLVAETEIALQEARTGQARARRRPEVSAQWGYTYIDGLDQEIGRPAVRRLIGVEGYAPGKGTATTNVSLTQVLYAGGQIRAAVKASEFLASSESWRREAVIGEIAYQARAAYHDALLAHALASVADEALEVFKRHLDDTEALAAEGAVTPFEVLRAKTEVGARRADRAAAEAAAQLADLNIKRLLALPEDQPLTFDRNLPGGAPGGPAAELKARALAQRPELRALADALASGDHQAVAVRGKYLPQAAATVSWVDVENGGRVLPEGWQFNVGARWDLYAGGQRKHERAEIRARIDGLRLQRVDMERLVALDVEQALIRLGEAAAAMRTDRESATLAEEGVRLAKLRYQEGFGTQTEIIDAALAHTQAKTALVRGIRDYYVACAGLRRALGGDVAAPGGGE